MHSQAFDAIEFCQRAWQYGLTPGMFLVLIVPFLVGRWSVKWSM